MKKSVVLNLIVATALTIAVNPVQADDGPALTPNQQAANGPFPGDISLYAQELDIAASAHVAWLLSFAECG